ncbi:MAG TPA: TlpA disulfide reductase family protein [Bryobacteraceae bacterium]|nr:TlpA disulfide reductase family protein [Bryobacteraceae bacterium]
MPNRGVLSTLAGVCLAATMAATIANGTDVPRPSPDFAINMIGGEQIRVSQYKGKVCALAFILTTCPHCQKTVGYLSTMQNEYGARGFQVVASAIEDMAKMNVPDFIKRFQPPFPVGFSNQNDVQNYLQHPVILRLLMPQLVFIDRKGTIRAQYGGDDPFFAADQDKHMREQIELLLKEAPASTKKHATAPAPKKAS